ADLAERAQEHREPDRRPAGDLEAGGDSRAREADPPADREESLETRGAAPAARAPGEHHVYAPADLHRDVAERGERQRERDESDRQRLAKADRHIDAAPALSSRG